MYECLLEAEISQEDNRNHKSFSQLSILKTYVKNDNM